MVTCKYLDEQNDVHVNNDVYCSLSTIKKTAGKNANKRAKPSLITNFIE